MDSKNTEIRIVFIGPSSKSAFFENLKLSSIRYEKHVAYSDTHYLTYNFNNNEVVVELFDPGLERTGAREMAIFRAHGAIIFYSVFSSQTVDWIKDVLLDFQKRKDKLKIPIVLIGNEDLSKQTSNCETTSICQSSASEGYESEASTSRNSESRYNKKHSQDVSTVMITREEGINMAKMFGDECKFVPIENLEPQLAGEVINHLIDKIYGRYKPKFKKFILKSSKSKSDSLNSTLCSIM